MNKIIRYFKGVYKETKRIRWPKKDVFAPTIMVVLVIASIAATFLLIEDLATGILIKQLRDAFTNMKG